MTTRRNATSHKECLLVFSTALKSHIKDSLQFWKSQNLEIARARQAAYEAVLFELTESANQTGVDLQDLGIEDYDVPKID